MKKLVYLLMVIVLVGCSKEDIHDVIPNPIDNIYHKVEVNKPINKIDEDTFSHTNQFGEETIYDFTMTSEQFGNSVVRTYNIKDVNDSKKEALIVVEKNKNEKELTVRLGAESYYNGMFEGELEVKYTKYFDEESRQFLEVNSTLANYNTVDYLVYIFEKMDKETILDGKNTLEIEIEDEAFYKALNGGKIRQLLEDLRTQ